MPASSNLHVVHGMSLPSTRFLSQLQSGTITTGVQTISVVPAGFPQPLALHTGAQRPQVTFTTSQLATLLTDTGVYGYSASSSNFDFFCKAASDLGVRVADATTNHLRFRATEGLLNWLSIDAPQDGVATASCRFVPTYDGTNAPLVAAGSVPLSGTPSGGECFGMGPVYHNGSGISTVTSWSLDLGISFMEVAADGEPYLTFIAVREIAPVLTIRGVRPTQLVTYGAGTAVTSSLACYLRRRTADGGFYSDASSQHIEIAATNGLILPQSTSGGGNEPMDNQTQILLRPATAADQALTITLSTTIP